MDFIAFSAGTAFGYSLGLTRQITWTIGVLELKCPVPECLENVSRQIARTLSRRRKPTISVPAGKEHRLQNGYSGWRDELDRQSFLRGLTWTS